MVQSKNFTSVIKNTILITKLTKYFPIYLKF